MYPIDITEMLLSMKHTIKLEKTFDQDKGLQIKTSELHVLASLSIPKPWQ